MLLTDAAVQDDDEWVQSDLNLGSPGSPIQIASDPRSWSDDKIEWKRILGLMYFIFVLIFQETENNQG